MLDIHPLAKLFQPLEGEAFDALVADIKTNGLHNCITLTGDPPLILDGQNRYRACLAAGVEPLCDTYDGDDPLGFVMSMNVARRHLDDSQRAMIAADIANMRQGERTDLGPSARLHEVSLQRAADMLKVSRRIVVDAKTVLKSGDVELINAVKAGETTVHKAVETVRRAEEDTRRAPEPAPERPKPEPHPADVMGRMRMNAQRLSGASLAALIAAWIMARVEVSLAIGSRADVMMQLGGGVAARSSISKWVRDDDVPDAQRASLVKEIIAAMNPLERNKLIEELAGGVASPINRVRI